MYGFNERSGRYLYTERFTNQESNQAYLQAINVMIKNYWKFALILVFSSLILVACGNTETPENKTKQIPVADKNLTGLFTDRNLQSCVDSLASGNQWTSSSQVTGTLDCSDKNISSLTGLEYLINLTGLNLSNNNIVNVAPIAALSNLKVVRLQNNDIGNNGKGNVDKLTNLTAANDINVAGNISVSCTELNILTKKLNGSGNPLILESAPSTLEIVNPEPSDKVNCTF